MSTYPPSQDIHQLPLISIVTPSYNRAWIIQRCIDCIRGQTYPNIEHIVVDGGSTDETLEILKKNQSGYNLRWISEKDNGMYDAINKGIKLATGKIVAYLNTDDFYFPYTVELAVQKFLQDETISLVYGDWVTYYQATGFLEILPFLTYTKYDMARFGVLPQPTVFIRREIFSQLGYFDTNYKLLADNEFFTRVFVANLHVEKINEFLAGQVVHEGNLLAGNSEATRLALLESDRFHNFYQAQLMGSPQGKNVFHQLYALVRSKTYRFIWRLRLIEFYIYWKLGYSNKWIQFRRVLPNQSIQPTKLLRYLIVPDRELVSYCIIPNFLDTLFAHFK